MVHFFIRNGPSPMWSILDLSKFLWSSFTHHFIKLQTNDCLLNFFPSLKLIILKYLFTTCVACLGNPVLSFYVTVLF